MPFEQFRVKGPECCSGDDGFKPKSKKHVRFSEDVKRNEGDGPSVSLYPKGVCACCKEADSESSSLDVGRPVLVYEIPEPKFDDMTTHKRDFGVKPMPPRQMPLWHPILKDRWRYLDVPSIDKSIYQSDFTPPINSTTDTQRRKPVYLAPDKEKRYPCRELSEDFKAWRKTSKGQGEEINVCDKRIVAKDRLLEISYTPTSETGRVLASDVVEDSKYDKDSKGADLHEPDCEKHCFSTPLMCHVESPNDTTHQNHDTNFSKNHLHSLPVNKKGPSNRLDAKEDYSYHPGENTVKIRETLELEPASCPQKCQFTLCESGMPTNLQNCWRTTGSQPQMPNSSDQSAPEGPYCPSYLTMYQRDFERPHLVRKEITIPDECGCTGNKEERKLYPRFERGGLI